MSRRRSFVARTLWAVFCLAILGVGLSAMPSGAQDLVPPIAVRAVDAREGLAIDVVRPGDASSDDITVVVGDDEVEPTSVVPLDEAGTLASVMVVIDNSAHMGNGAVQITKDQLEQLAPGDGGVGELGVVTIGGNAAVLMEPTGSFRAVENAVRAIGPTGGAALWEGISRAAESFDDDGQHHIVVVTGSADAGVGSRFPDMLAAVRESGATMHVIALTNGSPELTALNELVGYAGGTMQTGSSNDLERQFGVIDAQIDDQYRITLPVDALPVGDELTRLEVKWDGAATEVAFRPGAHNVGAHALAPLSSPTLISRLFASTLVKWLIVVLGTAAAGMIVYATGMLISRRKEGLDFALRHYESYAIDEVEYDDEHHESLARGAMMKRAVALTGNLAQRQGLLTRVEELLERADLPLRPAEALFFYAAIALVVTILAGLVTGNLLWVGAMVLLAVLVPKYVVQFLAKRRNKRFVAQLPDMLQLLAGTLRAGYSIGQGFEAVSQEIDDPMGKELRRVIAEARLGRPLEEALDGAAERMASDDFTWAVMAIRIQREVGGNLAELLMTVAETMTQRERLRRDVNTLTAEGRISAIVLGLLPPGLGLVMFTMNPDYIGRLLEDGMGLTLLIGAVVMMLIGFAWMKKIIKIEI